MSEYSFKLPDLGEGSVESEISAWHVAVGDSVDEDQVIADVQTDKAVVEVGSPVSGVVLALGCQAGEMLAVGAELARCEVGGSVPAVADQNAESGKSDEDKEENLPQGAASRPALTDDRDRAGTGTVSTVKEPAPAHPVPRPEPVFTEVLASPSLRRRAREEGVNLALVPGSGPGGRISHEDLEAFISHGAADSIAPGNSLRALKTSAGDKVTEVPSLISEANDEEERNQERGIFSRIAMRTLGFGHRRRRVYLCPIRHHIARPPLDTGPKGEQ